MAKLNHIALSTQDVEKTAASIEMFDMTRPIAVGLVSIGLLLAEAVHDGPLRPSASPPTRASASTRR